MAANDGIERMNLLAQRIAIFGSLLGAALWILAFVLTGQGPLFGLLILLIFPLLISLFLRVITWIVEGFLRPRDGRKLEPTDPSRIRN